MRYTSNSKLTTTVSCFLAGLLLTILCSDGFSQVHKVMEFGIDQGLPQPYVYTINQDSQGYLWIGTSEGLVRFNGLSFEHFTTEDNLSEDFITTSMTGEEGTWFGHMGGGISYFNGQSFSKLFHPDSTAGTITEFRSYGDDEIWASTQSDGIWQMRPGKDPFLFSDQNEQVPIFSFAFISPTDLLIGSMEGLFLYTVDKNALNLKFRSRIEQVPETKIQKILKSQTGNYYYILTIDEGIFRLENSGQDFTIEPVGLDIEPFIEGAQHIFEDSQGNLWVSTFGYGLYKLIPDASGKITRLVTFDESNGIPDNNIKVVFEDREGNVWIGMYGSGLARLIDESYTFFHFDDNLFSNNIYSIYSNDSYKWFGTERSLQRLDRQSGEIKTYNGQQNGLPEDIITAITISSAGDLWIGTDKNGVFRMKSGSDHFNPYFISEGTLENSINAISASGEIIWIATDKGACKVDPVLSTLNWFTISKGGIPHNTVNYIQIDRSNRVWISTLSNTLCYILNDVVERIPLPGIAGSLNIRAITMDTDENIWIGTYGNGVFKLSGDSVVNISSYDGLLSDYCYSIVSDDRNTIWTSHRGGLSEIRVSDNFARPVSEEIGIGVNTEFNVNAVYKDSEGVISLGTTNGVLSYNPFVDTEKLIAPLLSITSVSVNIEEVEIGGRIVLPPGRHDIRIEFIGIHLKNPKGVEYSTRMEGFDDRWSEKNRDAYVTYNKIADGTYRFMIRAESPEGIVSESEEPLTIIIRRPLWKQWWFYILIILLLSTGLIVYIRRREYALKREKQLLEMKISERTEQVVKQKKEIESQHDAIKSQNEVIRLKNKSITDSIVYASRIQNALFPPEGNLTKLFSDSFVYACPKDIVSGDFYWFTKKRGQLIATVSDCTGHGVPGAFMSMLGITHLNDIVNHQGIIESDRILNELRSEIIKALRQSGEGDRSNDGMDMALCVYDPGKNRLQFSGGFNPLILIRDGSLTKFKGDPMPVGIGGVQDCPFTKHDLEIQSGDAIYLFSDGYEDQFGGERDKKFSRRRLHELLIEINELPMRKQRSIIEKTITLWMKDTDQIDDITVMGIRFP